jgi:hypothetical protein
VHDTVSEREETRQSRKNLVIAGTDGTSDVALRQVRACGLVLHVSVANYAILSQADNAELSDCDPFDVWRSLKGNQREWATVQMCFTAREDLLKAYGEFLDFRAEKLVDELNSFLVL